MDSDEDNNLDPIVVRRQKQYKERINFNPDNFKERFRLTRGECERLIISIGDLIESNTQRSHALTANEKLLTALRFFATVGFYFI